MSEQNNKEHHFWSIAFILLVTSSLLCAGQDWDPQVLENRIDAYVLPYVQSNNFSGAILIARSGKMMVRKGYGMANYELSIPNTPETVFHVASIAKSFTAAAVILRESELPYLEFRPRLQSRKH